MHHEIWSGYTVSNDNTHHLLNNEPAYRAKFLHVMSFHPPGFAAAKDSSGAYHINSLGNPVYPERYVDTFGFYSLRAAVMSSKGCFHIVPDGAPLYPSRFAWCGNYQGGFCVVSDENGEYFHIDLQGNKISNTSFRYAGDFREGYATVQNEQGLYSHIDPSGKYLHNKWFFDLDVFHKGYARAKDSQGWFHINRQGDPIYPQRFLSIEPFYNGQARVETYDESILIINSEGKCIQTLRERRKDPFHQASGAMISYWSRETLLCAGKLKIFDLLPSTLPLLSKQLQLPFDTTKRLVRALQEMHLVKYLEEEAWALTEVGIYFQSHHSSSLHSALELWSTEHYSSWKDLYYSLKTGQCAFEHQFGTSWFKWLKQRDEKRDLYHNVLSIYATRDYEKLSSLIDFSAHKCILDIGGSRGDLLFQLLKHYQHLKGILLDLPGVFNEIQIEASLKNRLQCLDIDFFQDWPSFQADGAILSRILHDWSDEESLSILKNSYSHLSDSPQSKLYIIEYLLNEKDGNGALLDLNMLVMTGGRERTLGQFQELLLLAHFKLENVVPLNEVSSVLIASKQ